MESSVVKKGILFVGKRFGFSLGKPYERAGIIQRKSVLDRQHNQEVERWAEFR